MLVLGGPRLGIGISRVVRTLIATMTMVTLLITPITTTWAPGSGLRQASRYLYLDL